jgi:hypothetical protein
MSGRQPQALRAAIDLLRIPSQVRALRAAPLPPGILLLLRLAAAESDAEHEAQKINKHAPEANRAAAIFFIEQVLLASNSDAYRMLGLDKTASAAELRRHMAYLLKWLHPDLGNDPHKARLARRVLVAWNEIKTGARSRDNSDRCASERAGKSPSRHAQARSRFKTAALSAGQTRPPEYAGWLWKRFKMRVWLL